MSDRVIVASQLVGSQLGDHSMYFSIFDAAASIANRLPANASRTREKHSSFGISTAGAYTSDPRIAPALQRRFGTDPFRGAFVIAMATTRDGRYVVSASDALT